MLDKVEDTQWGPPTSAWTAELRDLYIHVKDLALTQRKHIESEFRATYLAEFDARARRDKKPKEDFSQFDLGSLELGLVNDEDLEETLKLNDMATKLRRYCEEELAALDQRIGVLLGDANLQGGQPVQPVRLQRLSDLPRLGRT
jgi:exonuclease VII small subunit